MLSHSEFVVVHFQFTKATAKLQQLNRLDFGVCVGFWAKRCITLCLKINRNFFVFRLFYFKKRRVFKTMTDVFRLWRFFSSYLDLSKKTLKKKTNEGRNEKKFSVVLLWLQSVCFLSIIHWHLILYCICLAQRNK